MRRVWLALALALLFIPATAGAEYWTLTGFGGYNLGGSIDISEDQLLDLDTKDGFTPGLALGYTSWNNFGFEVSWMYRPQTVEGREEAGDPVQEFGNVDAHEFMGNFLFAPAYPRGKAIPYFLFGLGLTAFYPEGDFDSKTRFAFALGAGVKLWTEQEKIGFRAQIRYHSTYMNSDEDGIWCDPWYCYEVTDSNWLDEFDFTGGIMLKFGQR